MFVYYEYGGQITDRNSEEPDKLDEVIAAYNTTLLGSYLITDDQICTCLSKTNVNSIVEVIFDTCHSGTLADQNRVPRFTTWAACSPTQLVYPATYPAPIGVMSPFSYSLQYCLNEFPTASRQEMIDAINAEILSWGPAWNQTASIEGTTAKKVGIPFTA